MDSRFIFVCGCAVGFVISLILPWYVIVVGSLIYAYVTMKSKHILDNNQDK